jgi:hypothetical protein
MRVYSDYLSHFDEKWYKTATIQPKGGYMQTEMTATTGQGPDALKNNPAPDRSKAQQISSMLKVSGGAAGGGAVGAAAALLSLGAMGGKTEAAPEEMVLEDCLPEITPDIPPPPFVVVIVAGDVSFDQAFAQAHQEAGGGGVFVYNGNLYNTFTVEEWADLTPEQHDAFVHQVADYLNSISPPDDPPFIVELVELLEAGQELQELVELVEGLEALEQLDGLLRYDMEEQHMAGETSGIYADVHYDDYCNDAEEAIEAMS